MNTSCNQCGNTFTISQQDQQFYDKLAITCGTKKYTVPPPTLCFPCRQKRRLAFRNERSLYNRKCDSCHKDMVTIYSPDKPYKVYCHDCWWADNWDGKTYGRDFDFSKTFTEQFLALQKQVPRLAIFTNKSENCDYTCHSFQNKNCYLSFGIKNCEDVYYSSQCIPLKNSLDCFRCNDSELLYQCLDCFKCYDCKYLANAKNCTNCYFGYDLIGCKNCLGCVSLRQAEYCIFNEQKTKAEYEKILAEVLNGSRQHIESFWQKFQAFKLKFPHLFVNQLNNENCTGDYLTNSKNCVECYDAEDLQDCGYSTFIFQCKDCSDLYGVGNSELGYESMGVEEIYQVHFCFLTDNSTDCNYCNLCFNAKNLFGCVGLKKAQYAILNKPMSQAEYEQLLPRVIEHMQKTPLRQGSAGQAGEWGEFFHGTVSPFGYNETVAGEYYPLTKEQAVQQGFNWNDQEPPKPDVKKIIPAAKLPDSIQQIPDEILNWAIECEVTKKPFRIIKQELKFYREHHLPVPRRHPDQRHKDRMSLRNPRKLWTRQCACSNAQHQHERVGTGRDLSLPGNNMHRCPQQFQTTYSPDRPEIVYCQKCYLETVY